MNKVILIGHIGRDAEVKYTQGGTAVATFNLATTETWKDRGGQRNEKTEWHRIVVWGKAAEALGEYLVKGKPVAVEGKLTTRQWEDKNGQKRYTTEIRSDQITLLGGGGGKRRDDDDGDDEAPAQTTRTPEVVEDDIQF